MRGALTRRGGAIPQLIDVIEAGDRVVVILEPPHHQGQSSQRVANLSTFSHGRVVEMRHYPDVDAALRAVGYS